MPDIDLESFEGLLDDAQQRAMLRDWLRSGHVPRAAAAGMADHGQQTTVVSMCEMSAWSTIEPPVEPAA